MTEAGSATETTRPLDLTYPPEVFSCRTSPYRSRPATAYTA